LSELTDHKPVICRVTVKQFHCAILSCWIYSTLSMARPVICIYLIRGMTFWWREVGDRVTTFHFAINNMVRQMLRLVAQCPHNECMSVSELPLMCEPIKVGQTDRLIFENNSRDYAQCPRPVTYFLLVSTLSEHHLVFHVTHRRERIP
jgi:hypothetical protein